MSSSTHESTSHEAALLREHTYLSKLAEKDREIARYKKIAAEIEWQNADKKTSLRGAFVDPVVGMELLRLRQQIYEKEEEVDGLQLKLRATQFKPTSISGEKLYE